MNNRVLKLLMSGELLSAIEIERRLNIAPQPRQQQVRNAIDALRNAGEPIWNDPSKKAFFWRNDRAAPRVGDNGWKRPYSE